MPANISASKKDGKLYLAFDTTTAIDFEENAEERIESADLEWKKLKVQIDGMV